jgi:hypothetical protein
MPIYPAGSGAAPAPIQPPRTTQYNTPELVVLHNVIPERELKKLERREARGVLAITVMSLFLFVTGLMNVAAFWTTDASLGKTIASILAATIFVAGSFLAGVAYIKARIYAGPVEGYIQSKEWNRLYGAFLKDLVGNINGDLVAVWKRHELVIKKLGLWEDKK